MFEGNISKYHSCDGLFEWRGCYSKDATYNKYITDKSFEHPAKMAWGLLDQIFRHLITHNWITQNSNVIDFMAGTGRTLIMAELFGYRSLGVELEPHFVEMVKDNIVLLERMTCRKTSIEIIQGDSQHLSKLLCGDKYVGVTSPPYTQAREGGGLNINLPETFRGVLKNHSFKEGNTDGQIGNLSDHPLIGITSPPYVDSLNEKKNTTSNLSREERLRTAGHTPDNFMGGSARNCSIEDGLRYSHNPLNIGNLPDRPLIGITSPPYEDQVPFQDKEFMIRTSEQRSKNYKNNRSHSASPEATQRAAEKLSTGYSENRDNIGASASSYLDAMQQVYCEAYRANISPLVVVTKNPTKGGVLRRLDCDTITLLETAGYEIFDYHRAILFEEHVQSTLGGEVFTRAKGHMSFFKRLSYQKGNVVARWEDIIFARK